MKRRNVEIGKMRRPIKRNKITEGFYGSTLLYLKFLILWVLVILADFILEFRFEFLWPFYLLLRSVYDSFKYQGLAFSIFFVCIALTSDMLCYFFVPVHWLFFAASTYVWVQYVWHTDRGICAPTIILWILFVYLEAAVRLRDVKHMPGHLDLCRPFAAHCIGYPVVTLGFGFKSYVGYRIRQRKQRDVARENEFYMQLMQQALPIELTTKADLTNTNNMGGNGANQLTPNVTVTMMTSSTTTTTTTTTTSTSGMKRNGHVPNGMTMTVANGVHHSKHNRHEHGGKHRGHNDNSDIVNVTMTHQNTSLSHQHQTVICGTNHIDGVSGDVTRTVRRREKKEADKEREANEYLQKLESDIKRLRNDLQNSRASEQDLRLQVAALTTSEKVSKGELCAYQREIDDLQQRLQNITSTRTNDRQTITTLERRLADERRQRTNVEAQLNQERKTRKQEEARAAQVAAAAAQSSRGECTDVCKVRRRELESELNECLTARHWAEERCTALERENVAMGEQIRDTEMLMSALNAMKERNAHLENSLSAETRIKLDLFSALGEAKRQIEISEASNRSQEKEIDELKSKIAQVLAVMPSDTFVTPTATAAAVAVAAAATATNPNCVMSTSRVRLAESPPGSTLDPNATAYTPKGSLVASTEA